MKTLDKKCRLKLTSDSDYYGDVHETSTATQIFNQAVSQGQNAGLVQHQKDPLKVLQLKILFNLKFV